VTTGKKPRRPRKPLDYKLVFLDVTGEFDEEGKLIPGTERQVYVEMPMPPGIDESNSRNRDAIERALRRAVYELGLEEYGNRDLKIAALGETIRNDYEKTTITRLLPPSEAKRLREERGNGVVSVESVEQ